MFQMPNKGLYTSAVSDNIPDGYSPMCLNVRFRYNQIVKTPGRSSSQVAGSNIIDWCHYTSAMGYEGWGALEYSPSGVLNNYFGPLNFDANGGPGNNVQAPIG